MSGTATEWYVGQEVWLCSNSRWSPDRRVTVTKVGRKLVTVEQYGRPYQYRMEDGRENVSQNGIPDWIETDDQRAERLRRLAELRAMI